MMAEFLRGVFPTTSPARMTGSHEVRGSTPLFSINNKPYSVFAVRLFVFGDGN